MKTLKVSDFAWNVECPTCGELINTSGEVDITDGDIIICPYCNTKYRSQIVDKITDLLEQF